MQPNHSQPNHFESAHLRSSFFKTETVCCNESSHSFQVGGVTSFGDLGKIGIPDAVLLKPGRLTPPELSLMQQHPEIGERLCASLHTLVDVRPIIRSHHERLDGSGYPDGLRGDAVPHLAQIVGIVDVYDALTSRRPFREAMTLDQAAQHLHDEVEKGRFSRQYVEAFLQLVNARQSTLTS